MSKELVARLRARPLNDWPPQVNDRDAHEAASRIEVLEAFVGEVREAATEHDASDTADAVDAALAQLDKEGA